MKTVCVLGAGSWGTALALGLGRKGIPVRLWDRDAASVAAINERRENARYLPGFELPSCITAGSDLAEALDESESVVVAVPSGAMREVLEAVRPALSSAERVWTLAAKGLEPETGLRMSEVTREALGNGAVLRLVALSGPNLAVELARGIPTASVAASEDAEAATKVQELFMSPTLRVYTNEDVAGVELGGALKNVLAIAAGICDALGYGDNTKGALLARGLVEMTRLGSAVGARPETFIGLTGVGDLFATAASRLSRNYRVGRALGEGKTLATVLEELGQVAEGVPTARAVMTLAGKAGVELPLFAAINEVVEGRLTPLEGVSALMQRAPKREM